MPKNKGKGGKRHRRGTKKNAGEKELTFKEDGQEYAQVVKMLGSGRIQAFCFDGVSRMCKIRGKLRKRVWINAGDIVLIGVRDFQDAKGDVILKYSPEEARGLKNYGELPESAILQQTGDENDEFEVRFGDVPAEENPNAQQEHINLTQNSSQEDTSTESDDESDA